MTLSFFSPEELSRLREAQEQPGSPAQYSVAWFKLTNRPLYILGCGEVGQVTRNMLAGNDLRGFLDNNPAKWGTTVASLEVGPPETLAAEIRAAKALVVLAAYDHHAILAMRRQCLELGLDYVDRYTFWCANVRRARLEELAENERCIQRLAGWDDARSCQVFRSIVRFRTTMAVEDMPDFVMPQYFIPEITPAIARSFVDIGAYNGDTLRDFRQWTGDVFDSYHAFEPMPVHREKWLAEATADARVHFYPLAVADAVGTRNMASRGSRSAFDAAGEVTIDAIRLDTALTGTAGISYIKMDVEGFEPEVLRGAEELIRRHRPILAVCVYHQYDHLWQIPAWIENLNLGYRLLLRHHSPYLAETVCYALPK